MTDSTLNRFLASGTNAERLAFTPSPPTPGSGPDPTYIWTETDTGDTFAWDYGGAAWQAVGAGNTTALSTSLSQVSSSLSSEISSRVSGDSSLSTVISSETSSRISGDTSLSTVISSSISTVTSSVNSLSTAVGSPGMVRIGGYTPSGVASFDIENFDGLTVYSQIIIVIEKLTVSTDSVGLTAQFKLNGSYQSGASSYKHTKAQLFSPSTASNVGSAGDTSVNLIITGAGGIGNASPEGASGTIILLNPYDTAGWKRLRYELCHIDDQATNRIVQELGTAAYYGTDATGFALAGVRIAVSSGTLTATVHVYGLKNS